MRFAKQAIILLATRALTIALGFVISVLVARTLGPQGQGAVAVITLIQGVVLALGDLGIPSAAAYYFKSGKRTERDLANGMLLFLLLILAAAAVFWAIFREQLAAWAAGSDGGLFPPVWFLLGFAALPGLICMAYMNAMLVVSGRTRLYSFWQAGAQSANLLLTLLLVVALRWGVQGALLAQFGGSICSMAVFTGYYLHLPKAEVNIGSAVTDLLSQGMQIYPVFLLGFLMKRGETAVLNTYAATATVGLYATGYMLFELILNVPRTLIWPVMGRISSHQGEQMPRATCEAVRAQIIVMLSIVILGAVTLPWLIPLVLGPAYRLTGLILLVLLPGLVLRTIHLSIASYFIAVGQPRRLIFAALCGATVDVGLALMLIPEFGVSGAAMASVASELTLVSGSTVVFLRRTGLNVRDLVFVGRKDAQKVARAISGVLRARQPA